MKLIKKTYLPCILLCFGVCLSFYWVFWLHCITTVTPFIRRSQCWSFRTGRVLGQSRQKCRFFAEIQIRCKLFQLQPKKETFSSSLGDRLGLRGTSGFPLVPVSLKWGIARPERCIEQACSTLTQIRDWGSSPTSYPQRNGGEKQKTNPVNFKSVPVRKKVVLTGHRSLTSPS